MLPSRHIHFITGKLAADALRANVELLSQANGFGYSIEVLPISVAALMTTSWIARHIHVPPQATEVMIPGYCEGDLDHLARQLNVRLTRGPRDLHELPRHFGDTVRRDYGEWSIELLAEINHATKLAVPEVLSLAEQLRADGADIIDVGCVPGSVSQTVGDTVRALVDAGHRMRVYVPFGEHWFAYSTRRLKENPHIASHIVKSLVVRG